MSRARSKSDLKLGLVEHGRPSLRQFRQQHPPICHRVRNPKHAQSLRIGEYGEQERPHVPDGFRCERPSLRFSFGSPTTMVFQAVDGFLNFGGGHFIQSRLAEFTDQIGSDFAVAFESLGCAATARVLLQPMFEILSERGPGTFDCFSPPASLSQHRGVRALRAARVRLRPSSRTRIRGRHRSETAQTSRPRGSISRETLPLLASYCVNCNAHGSGRGVLRWEPGLEDLNAFTVFIPSTEEDVSPANTCFQFSLEDGSCHSRYFSPANFLGLMTVTSEWL